MATDLAWTAVREHAANQNAHELAGLLAVLRGGEPLRQVLEIGSQDGGMLWALAQVAPTDARFISVDTDHSQLRDIGRPVHLVGGDSRDDAVIAHVTSLVDPPGLDFAFIDGDHSYEATKHDWETYGPLVRPDGLVGFHDIRPSEDSGFGGWRLWQELLGQEDLLTIQIVERNGYHTGWGIGLVRRLTMSGV